MQTKTILGEIACSTPSADNLHASTRPQTSFKQALPLLALLVLCQAAMIALFVHPRSALHTNELAFITQLGIGIKYVIYFFSALLLALTARLPALWRSLSTQTHHRPVYLAGQLLSYGFLLAVIGVLIPNDLFAIQLPVNGHEAIWRVLLLASMTATVLSTLLLFAPASYWWSFVKTEWMAIALALLFTIGIYYITGIFQNTWDDFLSVPTIVAAKSLLELFYGPVYADPVTKELGLGHFIVLISSTCSGYEGMGMIVAFLTWYSLTFRQELRYPQALLLFPIAVFAMWIFNCIRIAALIAIGYSISPDIAMQGFHSNAGWIYFLCISIGLIICARRIRFFSGRSADPILQIDAQNVMLVPELVLLTATLLSAAFSAQFEWLYPVRVVATGLVLAYFWKVFQLQRLSLHFTPILIGILVFIAWILFVPVSHERSRQFAEHLGSVPATMAFAWIAIRALGTVLIVPLAEELAFRGYLLNLLSKKAGTNDQSIAFAWMPMLLSSLLFGALHSQWLAGTLAGIAFAYARYQRGRLWDAIVAHAVTNGLLAAYVLAYGHWSYW